MFTPATAISLEPLQRLALESYGKVIGTCLPRHRGKEFIKFLNQLEQRVPPKLDIHLILDNYSTHKSAAVQRWFKRPSPIGSLNDLTVQSGFLMGGSHRIPKCGCRAAGNGRRDQ
jgi:transposase